MTKQLRLLHAEDSEADAAIVVRALSAAGYEVSAMRVETAEDLQAALQIHVWDIVVSDFQMPGLDANAALRIFKATGLDIPFIVISGTIGEDVAVDMMRAGAHDYLLKDNLTRLGPAVARELSESANRREAHRSRTQRDLMFNLSLDALCVSDLNNKTMQVNAAWRTILGWNPDEVLGREWIEFVHPDDVPSSSAIFKSMAAGTPIFGFENRLQCRDGSYRWLSWNVAAVPEQQLVFAHGRDITEKRKADAQLKLLGTCISELNDGVVVTQAGPLEDPGPPIVFVNDAFLTLTGYTRDEVIGRSPRFLHGEKTDPAELVRIRDAMAKGEPVAAELISYTRDGREFCNEMVVVPIHDTSGKVSNFAAVQRDVTERRHMEQSMREGEQHFRELAAFNEKMVHEVNHRVRNNLASLLSLITMCKKQAKDVSGFAASIEGRVRSLSYVHNLMSNSGGRPMKLRSIVENLNSVASQLDSVGTIEVVIEGPQIWLDPIQIVPLAFTLVELFNNSVEHGARSAPTGRLEIVWTASPMGSNSKVSLHWKEAGGPAIALPAIPKLGLYLIEGFVEYDLGGTCALTFLPTGTDHLIEFSVPAAADRS